MQKRNRFHFHIQTQGMLAVVDWNRTNPRYASIALYKNNIRVGYAEWDWYQIRDCTYGGDINFVALSKAVHEVVLAKQREIGDRIEPRHRRRGNNGKKT